jgi:3-oxoadipate enol-lactonase
VLLNRGDFSLHYEALGPAEGLPIVFLHGFPFSRRMWAPQITLLRERYRVIAYDHRGHGDSGVGTGQYFLEDFVDDLTALLDQLNVQKAVLCGLSMGGYVALRAIERHPERVQGLILCDTRSEADTNEAKIKRAKQLKSIRTEGLSAFCEGFLKAVFAPASFVSQTEAVELIRSIILTNPAAGVGGTLLALAARTDTTAALPKIAVPTLILVGEKDAITPPSAAEALQKAIPGSEMHVIPSAAHMSNLENTAIFNERLQAFLKSRF